MRGSWIGKRRPSNLKSELKVSIVGHDRSLECKVGHIRLMGCQPSKSDELLL